MKKLLIFLGLLTLSSNLFSMDEKQQTKPIPQKQQLSKWEKAKIGAAMFGCAFFTWSTIFNRSTKSNEAIPNIGYSPYHLPSAIITAPLVLINQGYKHFFNEDSISVDMAYNTSVAYSAIFAALCGAYIYKKLKQPAKISEGKA